MKANPKPCTSGMWLSLLLLCVCATSPAQAAVTPAPELPGEVTINKRAGRGDWLIVTLQLESAKELALIVDTGAEVSILDKSLEPRLGERLGTGQAWNFGVKHKVGAYATPRLFLGSMELKTREYIVTIELKREYSSLGRSISGILGMDCLRYYCIQLDFEAGKLRFLDPLHLDATELGTAFPLVSSGRVNGLGVEDMRPVISVRSPFGGQRTNVLVDTGYENDGALESGFFRREILGKGGTCSRRRCEQAPPPEHPVVAGV